MVSSRSIVLAALAATACLAAAQNDLPELSTVTEVPGATLTDKTTSQAATSADAQSSSAASSAASSTAPASSTADPTTASSSASITAIYTGFTNAPTLAGVGVPALIVPDTSAAPFMQRSKLPEGLVFICVGAILAFLGFSVLAWRALVAWSVKRSVRRAATAKFATDSKSIFGLRGASSAGYQSMYGHSDMSLEDLASTNTAYTGAAAAPFAKDSDTGKRSSTYGGKEASREARRHSRHLSSQAPHHNAHNRSTSRTPTASNLFYSPTAGAGNLAAANERRSSRYLPAGYYASGASLPAGASAANLVGGGNGSGYSPPESPASRPARSSQSPAKPQSQSQGRGDRNSRLLNVGGGGATVERRSRLGADREQTNSLVAPSSHVRAPSAFLEDLFENHGGMGRQ